jgi:exosortase
MFGYPVIREGNIIHLNNITVAVAEACNGLRMVTAFIAINTLVVMLIRRAWWEKLIVLLSSLPIALLCNTLRLTITAIAFTMLQGENWERIFHDFGGYAMMPLALTVAIFELWLLMKLVPVPENKPQEIIIRKSAN